MERWLALALALIAVPVSAQVADPVAGTAGDDLVFTDVEQRMTVPVSIAGAGPYAFVVDTGAQRSVISRQLARRLGLPAGRRVRLTAMSGSGEVDTVIIPSLSVSILAGERIEAPALEAQHLGAPGMLGIDTLQGHSLGIDFDRRTMTVAPAVRRDRRRSRAPDEIVIQARSLFGQLVVTDAKVMGKRVRVVLDTGTSVSMGNLALRRLITRRAKGLAPAVFTSVLGGEVVADYVSVPEMQIGSATLRGLPIAFADAAPFRAFGLEDRPAILLGMDALKLFRRVDIDFANRELRLLLPRNVERRDPLRIGA
ncbi:retroviral-like aspartic protease family protein [Sphingomonas sp. Leaf412]|uniref:retroviral-like aspartic protease family protein n=1 Tax=Sphingomonas sp. Leaf412 TaxID=1736370 RepID=UPI0009EB0443|nr:retroviral-like aspartic protease family protein [Sphingomonas sp. Leaf412]